MLIDGLVLPEFNDQAITQMFAGGLDAAVYPAAIWQDAPDALVEFARVRRIISASEKGTLIRSVADIRAARAAGKVGIIIGWQNSDGFAANLDLVHLYQELGLRTLSPAFNFANAAGGGCYEPRDGGLTSYGRDLVECCNDLGILLDLTHVGDRTGADIVQLSARPVCYSHAGVRALQSNVRNKTDEQLRSIAAKGGVVGIAALPHYLPGELKSTFDDYIAVVRHVLNVIGEDHLGFGTDMIPGRSAAFLRYTASRKGVGVSSANYQMPPQLPSLSDFSDYRCAIERLSEILGPRQVEKFAGRNWLRIFQDSWR